MAGSKRGRGSQNKTPFLAVVQVTEDGQPVVMKLGVVEGFRKDAVQEWAGQNVKPGTHVNTDGLGCFKGFAAAGCKHAPRVTGGGPGSCETPGLGWPKLSSLYTSLERYCSVKGAPSLDLGTSSDGMRGFLKH